MQSQPPETPEQLNVSASKEPETFKDRFHFVIVNILLMFFLFIAIFGIKTLVQMSPPDPVSDRLIGMTSIDAGLASSDTLGMVIPVTYHDGKIDLLFAGAPECLHCQDFVENDFDDLVEYAKENNLDLAYMPVALSGLGVSISAVESCALEAPTIHADDVVKAGYSSVKDIEAAARAAVKAAKSGMSQVEADAILMTALADLHKKISPSTEFDMTCYEDAADLAGARMGSFSETFSLTATPSFYFSDPKGGVLRSVGQPDYLTVETALGY